MKLTAATTPLPPIVSTRHFVTTATMRLITHETSLAQQVLTVGPVCEQKWLERRTGKPTGRCRQMKHQRLTARLATIGHGHPLQETPFQVR